MKYPYREGDYLIEREKKMLFEARLLDIFEIEDSSPTPIINFKKISETFVKKNFWHYCLKRYNPENIFSDLYVLKNSE